MISAASIAGAGPQQLLEWFTEKKIISDQMTPRQRIAVHQLVLDRATAPAVLTLMLRKAS